MTGKIDFADTMRTRMQADLRNAMKRRDAVEVSTLRCLIAAIDNAGAVASPVAGSAGPRDWSKASAHVVTGDGPTEVARRVLTADEVAALVQREWDARETSATTLERHGRDAATQREEMAIVGRYLKPNAEERG